MTHRHTFRIVCLQSCWRSHVARRVIGLSVLIIIIVLILGIVSKANAFERHGFNGGGFVPARYTQTKTQYLWSDKYGLWFVHGTRTRPILARPGIVPVENQYEPRTPKKFDLINVYP